MAALVAVEESLCPELPLGAVKNATWTLRRRGEPVTPEAIREFLGTAP